MIDFELYKTELAEEPEAAYSINKELNLAWDIIENTGANLFLTGKAGTGKTTFLKRLQKESAKNLIVLAPTGVAAINAGGTTIHSFFQFPFSPFIPGKGFVGNDKKHLNLTKMKRRVMSSLSLIVIDEISMVRPDILDAIDWSLRRVRNSRQPFGGVQLLLIGDLRQLSPVVKEEEWSYLSPYYDSPYFFDSESLKRAGYQSIELTKVYRQKDLLFVEILNKIREGKTDQETLKLLNSRCCKSQLPEDTDGYIRLTTHNYRAAKINTERLEALPTKEWSFEANISGKFPEFAYPAEKTLTLKVGAQVMFIKNDSGADRKFYNGMIGTVVSIANEKIRVRPLDCNHILDVVPMVWDNMTYTIDEATGEVKQEESGKFEQFPLQLAWAITIHKSQGLTFDKAIIDAGYSFAAGQTYVALSRCRTLDGILLESPIPPHAIIIDNKANDFINYCERHSPTPEVVEYIRKQYLADLLRELFDFSQIRQGYLDFQRLVFEYVLPVYPDIQSVLNNIGIILNINIIDVAGKFIEMQSRLQLEEELQRGERKLTERIKNGCKYFQQQLLDLKNLIVKIPLDLDNKGYTERLKNTFDSICDHLSLKILLLQFMSEVDFNIKNYQSCRAKSLIRYEQEATSMSQSKHIISKDRKPKKEKKPKGYSAFETLKLWKAGKDMESISKIRGLTISTITDHLAQMIKVNKLALNNILDNNTIAAIDKICQENKDKNYTDILGIIQSSIGERPEYRVALKLLRKTSDA